MVIDATERFAQRTADYIINLDRAEATKRFALFTQAHRLLILKLVKAAQGVSE